MKGCGFQLARSSVRLAVSVGIWLAVYAFTT
jgi:hypothetical protein